MNIAHTDRGIWVEMLNVMCVPFVAGHQEPRQLTRFVLHPKEFVTLRRFSQFVGK